MWSGTSRNIAIWTLVGFIFSCQGELKVEHGQMLSLNGKWELTDIETGQSYVATVPGTVHTDLMANEALPDPFIGVNEHKALWVERKNWAYTRSFELRPKDFNQNLMLVCEGLDTYADISINGIKVGETNNMFLTHQFEIEDYLKNGVNTIKIVFHSPFFKLEEDVMSLGYILPADNEEGEIKYSPFCRKAAYHFGWDWAPRLVTSGIWKDIYLKSTSGIEVANASVQTIEIQEGMAKLELLTIIDSKRLTEIDVTLGGLVRGRHKIEIGRNELRDTFYIDNPSLWWPNGSGVPNMYDEVLTVVEKGKAEVSEALRFGIRTTELIQEEDGIGTSFYFKINGKPIFAKGANYIPQDVFLPRVEPANYRRLLLAAKEANMNMIRVWGGGVYEKDLFYDLCDSLGLMVWQDFMFAGTMYPVDSEFLENVKLEVDHQIRRLRRHPCVVIWCGNNEIDVAWHNWGWQEKYNYTEQIQEDLWQGYESLFLEMIPSRVKALSPNTPYTPTSPLSNWGAEENFNHGSMHYWGVWHGRENIDEFKINVGRFMTEYGMQSYPEMSTILKFAEEKDCNLSSHIMNHRQKSYIGNTEILRQVRSRYGMVSDFQDFIHKSQRLQAEGLGMAIKAHINSEGHCMGSLLWQLNDCWPGPSWSIIDYYGKKKTAYQTVKDHFR